MPKEKNYNPVQAQRKADKARAVKKTKTENQGRRNEKLARKNPERLQKQIDDLKAVADAPGGKLSRHEESLLEGLEKEVKAVRKAREALGDKAPTFGRWGGDRGRDENGGRDGRVLGKRRREESSDEEDVPEDVRRIPMPRDTPPPIPKEEMDGWWARRRARRAEAMREEEKSRKDNGDGKTAAEEEEEKPAESKTVYEAKPVVRDLRKEAVSAFMPAAVQRKMDKGRGQGGLMEPEEADELEREGYLGGGKAGEVSGGGLPTRTVTVEDAEEDEE